MSERLPELQAFLDALRHALQAQARANEPAADLARRIFGALQAPAANVARESQRLPACRHIEAAVSAAATGPAPVARLAAAFTALAPKLRWHTRANADAAGEPFLSGHANAFVVGPDALEPRGDVWIGISLMAPAVTYPDHGHPPEEVYVAMSPGCWRQEDGPWTEPGLGGIVYNRPGIRHAMRSGSAPLLAAWCLWLAK